MEQPGNFIAGSRRDGLRRGLGLCASLAAVLGLSAPAEGYVISGTMSNFDVFNETETEAHGAELELEDVHSNEVFDTYPSHFDNMTMEDYSDGIHFGTRIRFTGYNFDPSGALAPSVGQNTNGHLCVNVPGCEHFGFAVSAQPTATRYFWLDANSQRIGNTPMAVPNPTWTYMPPANPGGAPVLRADVAMPEPAEAHAQQPDSVWMKVFKTEVDRAVGLDELISAGDIVPEDESETETEWELLEGGKMDGAEADVGENDKAVVRRYEFFEYTGPYDDEHEPTSIFLDQDLDEPPAGELGQFIAANMVAAILVDLVEGDTNHDGVVDLVDLNNVRNNFGGAGVGDTNGDDFVDLVDLNNVRNHFGDGANAAAVPEPSSLSLGLLLVTSIAVAGRQGLRRVSSH